MGMQQLSGRGTEQGWGERQLGEVGYILRCFAVFCKSDPGYEKWVHTELGRWLIACGTGADRAGRGGGPG